MTKRESEKVCAYCMRPFGRRDARITVQNTDAAGTLHRFAWHAGTDCTRDPVFRAIVAEPRIPEKCLMIIAERLFAHAMKGLAGEGKGPRQ